MNDSQEDRLDVEHLRSEYPPNKKIPEEPAKKVEKIIEGKVTTRKKSMLHDFSGEVKNVSRNVFVDILVPAAKSLISDMISGGIEMLLFGERTQQRRPQNKGLSSFISYGNYYQAPNNIRSQPNQQRRDHPQMRHNFKDVIFETREEASNVLYHLSDLIQDYGQASVMDLYGLVGLESKYTDDKWGWIDLDGVSIIRVRGGGYTITLPRAVLIE